MPEEKKSEEVIAAGSAVVMLRDGAIVVEMANFGYLEMGPDEAENMGHALLRAVKYHREGGPVTDATKVD